jgi:hypothetical protein
MAMAEGVPRGPHINERHTSDKRGRLESFEVRTGAREPRDQQAQRHRARSFACIVVRTEVGDGDQHRIAWRTDYSARRAAGWTIRNQRLLADDPMMSRGAQECASASAQRVFVVTRRWPRRWAMCTCAGSHMRREL